MLRRFSSGSAVKKAAATAATTSVLHYTQQQRHHHHSSNSSSHSSSYGRRFTHASVGAALSAACLSATAVFAVSSYAYDSPTAGNNKPVDYTTDTHDASLPVISLAEVAKHKSAGDVWVTYRGGVYDVTSFVNKHPGGRELLLTAAGLDLGHFFDNFTVHKKTEKAHEYLAGMKIGRLSAEDAKKARDRTTPAEHVRNRMHVLNKARMRLLAVISCSPFFLLVRLLIWGAAFLLPSGLAHVMAESLPFSVPGLAGAQKIAAVNPATKKRTRIAVIGGGIAGSGCAYALKKSGYDVTLYEARESLSGNAHTFDWDVKGKKVRSCVSVTAWPPILYKNYVALLKDIGVKTTPIHLSWFLNSKVPGHEGFLWAADPSAPDGSLRKHFQKDFDRYESVAKWVGRVTKVMSLQWGCEPSMYAVQSGLGVLNPFATFPLHHLCRMVGISQAWWDIIYTPHYTASYLTDKLDNVVSVTAPIMEDNIPLIPTSATSKNNVLQTCETWADAGQGIRDAFDKMTAGVNVKLATRVLKVNEVEEAKNNNGRLLEVIDDHGGVDEYDRVVFACPCNAVGNMIENSKNWIEDAVFAAPEYADDHHPATGHMHAIMHNDANIIAPEFREEVLKRGSNYVEITELPDGTLNIENTYNFGVQTPSTLNLPLSEKPPMLITHALGEGRSIDPSKILGEGNHGRAHPLYSGWNVANMLMLRLVQGRRGVYYCANYTTPGNCHDMSFLSGLVCAHSIGADYPFEGNEMAKKDFNMLRGLMGM